MSEKKPPKKLPIEYLPHVGNVVSDTECTGIAYHSPQSDEEWENEMDLYTTSLPPVWDEDVFDEKRTPHE